MNTETRFEKEAKGYLELNDLNLNTEREIPYLH